MRLRLLENLDLTIHQDLALLQNQTPAIRRGWHMDFSFTSHAEMRGARIAFVTRESAPGIAADDALAVEALAAYGVEVVAAPWGDAATDWTAFHAVVLRSCWDYYLRLDAFEAWLRNLARRSVPIVNPAEVVFQTLDKRYLLRLAAAGLPVIPTRYVAECTPLVLTRAIEALGSDEWVVKPTVSAEAFATYRGAGFDTASVWPQIAPALSGRSVMVQPYLPSIASFGELSLVYFHGTFSHAVCKRPAPGDFRVQTAFAGSECLAFPDPECVALGARTLAEPWINRPPFARVDLVQDARGWEIMEVELIEPRLYLGMHWAAPDRFAAALAQTLTRPFGAAVAHERPHRPR